MRGAWRIQKRAAARVSLFVTLVASCMALNGCGWWNKEGVIYESPGGSVVLEQLPTRGTTGMYRPNIKSIQTSHPVRLDPATLALALRGVHLREGTPATMKPQRVFSDEEVAFLAPQLSTALSQAAADQRVRFHIVPPAAVGSGATEGTLYVDEPLLHLTLREYRHRDLEERQLGFVPESARHPEAERKSQGLFGADGSATLAINYTLLIPSSLPEPSPAPALTEPRSRTPPAAPAPPSPEELQALKEHVIKKDMENEALKEEIRALQRKLADQDAASNKLKKRKDRKEQPKGRP